MAAAGGGGAGGSGASRSTAIVWFKNDLRVHDNGALVAAHDAVVAASSAPGSGSNSASTPSLLPTYCFDPRIFGSATTHAFHMPKTGGKARFILESVEDLRDRLRERGSDLLVRVGRPEEVLPLLAREVGAARVYAQKETCAEELAVERNLRRELAKIGVKLELIWGGTMYHADDLPFDFNHVPDSVESRSRIRDPLPTPVALAQLPSGLDMGVIPSISDLCPGQEDQKGDPKGVLEFRGGESVALARMKHYFWDKDCLKEYKHTRNGMLGADYSSKFSPWLAHGCISPRLIHSEVKRYEKERVANDSTYWLLFELIWRDYFRFLAERVGDSLFRLHGPRHVTQGKEWRRDDVMFAAWRDGMTGYPLVDANMRELKETGYMSNRGRQIVCSFLTRDMGLDWRMGAEWFETCLLDYDPHSNYGNWTYGAGVGTDPREDRYFSIPKQASNYDSDGAYVAHWIPPLANVPPSLRHSPYRLTPEEQQRYGIILKGPDANYVEPVVPLKFGGGGGGGGRGGGHGGRNVGRVSGRGGRGGGGNSSNKWEKRDRGQRSIADWVQR
eukprot:jgi/Chlat1/3832/Chrsp26S04060